MMIMILKSLQHRILVFILLNIICILPLIAQTNPIVATLQVNSDTTFQKITGFGGFVCSGTFGYNHMTTDEIRKVWGKNSEAGYNIMRLYIPIASATATPTNPSAWSQSLATAQLAKSLGILTFASPWSMPAEWKAYNTINAEYDSSGTKKNNYLLPSHYADYANYLNNYATYLRDNNAELTAISIQNEPDWRSTYAGCIWSPQQISDFVKYHGRQINCPIIAPEGTGITNDYATAFTDDSVCANYQYFAGHQYSYIQDGLKQVQAKGKEVWMTEYLINWNADENTTRNFNWKKDAFKFAGKVNSALLSNVNAWIHYATKRYYGLLGDGTNGTTVGVLTKRGYILSHFAKYTIGTNRIENTWTDPSGKLSGSSYITATGDSIIVMVINPTDSLYNLTIDLPFYTLSGKLVKTSELESMVTTDIILSSETCRPKVIIDPSGFYTLVFKKSSVRPESQMTGTEFHYNKMDSMVTTNAMFGNGYRLSGKTITFDVNHKLISSNSTSANGYLMLNDRYNQIVFHISDISSAMNYTSANTTLYYINSNGVAKSHNYGTVNFNQNGNYDWVLDISPGVLTDGCIGILGMSNTNYSSILTITFGDVFFRVGDEKTFSFSGTYSTGDSNELICLDDKSYTSLDYTNTTGITSLQNWFESAINKNCIYYVGNNVANANTNVVTGDSCSFLSLTDSSGNFNAPVGFTATAATYTCSVNGSRLITLPFESSVPSEVSAYTVQYSSNVVNGTKITDGKIPANTPVLIVGTGKFSFDGAGNVSTPHNLKVNDMNAGYIATKAYAGSYYLNTVNGLTAFFKVVDGAEPNIPAFSAYLAPGTSVTASGLPIKLDGVWFSTCDVNFNTDGGSDMDTLTVPYNSILTTPAEPVKTGYAFAGWYKEATCTNSWDFDLDVVNSSVTLYAGWTINNYTVSFNTDGGSPVASVLVNYNSSVSEPTAPARSGYTFAGWYKEAACTNIWSFASDVITENITLYAKWDIVITGTNNPSATGISLYPNPVMDVLYIDAEFSVKSCRIYDLQGAIIVEVNPGITRIDVSHLPKGIYIVKISTSERTTIHKIIRE